MHRPEHPKPQFRRDRWLNLNGVWRFGFDFGLSGEERGLPADPSKLDLEINVPFCPESALSGIGYRDFIPAVWYQRSFKVPRDWDGSRVFLHFGAVDYDCRAWVNGKLVGRHYGGSSSFSFEITEALASGETSLVVCAEDDVRSGVQPAGKQSRNAIPHGCHYSRTTGIWQTVWLEARPDAFIESVRIVPDLDGGRFVVTPVIVNSRRGLTFKATLISEGTEVAAVTVPAASGGSVVLDVPEARVWSLADPFLYDLRLELHQSGTVIDRVHGYAGLRKFHIEGNRFLLNNEPIFLRLVLDQGYYPEGTWTAPTDEDLKADIERGLALGFNGARLHQKIFEERFHYWADRLGYLTWGELGNWGMNFTKPQAIHNHQREWREVVMRDLNHPSIVTWTPFNETIGGARANFEAHRRAILETVELTRHLDPTRPVNDVSGFVHVETDIYTIHDYEQDTEKFAAQYADVGPGVRKGYCLNHPDLDIGYKGEPFVLDEYGGTWWDEEESKTGTGSDQGVSWGYGARVSSIDEIYARIEGLTAVLTGHPHIAGYCYTQLTDVEQEKNGLYTYDRQPKFDLERLRKAFSAPARIEQPD